jgi:hypothetical protein
LAQGRKADAADLGQWCTALHQSERNVFLEHARYEVGKDTPGIACGDEFIAELFSFISGQKSSIMV